MADPKPLSLYLASPCYGGVAQAGFLRALLALRAACAARNISLQLDLGGGEALASRGRAAMLAAFLATGASHLVFADNERDFAADALLDRLGIPDNPEAARLEDGLLLINRPAALALTNAYSTLAAGLADVGGPGRATMVFDGLIEPDTGRYLADLDAFWWRWTRICEGDPPA